MKSWLFALTQVKGIGMMFFMDLQLQFFGTPVLRQRADEVETPTPELHALAEQMLGHVYAERGVGLAAEQVDAPSVFCDRYTA